jgi:hypothetical protein
MEEATGIVLGFANLVDTLFLRYSGKTLAGWLAEPASRPRELPAGERIVTTEPDMPLVDAYMVMGLPPQGASMEEIEKRYRSLANLFHPDRGGYKEAMVLLNRAYDRIKKERKK